MARVFRGRYYPGGTFGDAGLGRDTSFVWRSIWVAWENLRRGLRWRVGDWRSIRVLGDAWLPSNENSCIETPVYDDLQNATISSLMNQEEDDWDGEILRNLFSKRERDN